LKIQAGLDQIGEYFPRVRAGARGGA